MTARVRRYLIRFSVTLALGAVAVYAAYKIFEDPGNQMFGQTFVSGPTDRRVVALTYDDGPNPPYTDEILQVLAKERVRATFFVVGRAVAQYPQTMRRMVAQGNAIGNHTWDHVHLVVLRRKALRSEMQRTDDVIYKTVGQRPRIMRPPFGARDWLVLDEMKKLGYTVVMWSVPLPRDWEYPPATTIAKRVVGRVKDGAIIVLHDGNRGLLCTARHLAARVCDRSADIEATRLIVDSLKRQGFGFVTVPELLAERRSIRHKSARGGE